MKKGFIKLVAAALAGMCLLSGCNSLPNGSNGPVEVPTTIKADFTQKEKKGNWIKYGDCKVTLKDGTAVITDRTASNTGIAIPCENYRGNTVKAYVKASSANDSMTLSLKYEFYGNVSYVNIAAGQADESGITEITGTI